MRVPHAAVIALAALLAAPPALAQGVGIQNPEAPTPTTLYFHLSAYQDFPINTQLPDDRFSQETSRGLTAPTTSCVPEEEGVTTQASKSFHTFYGFSTPGYVEYDFTEETNGQSGPRIHPERGLASDVRLATDEPAHVYWYLKTQFTGGDRRTPEDLEDLPTIVPEASVRATIRTGDEVSIGAEAYNSGDLIAQGQSAPVLLAPVASEHYLPQDDGSHVYEFKVPLEFSKQEILEEEAYNVRIDVFMDVPPCNEDPDASLMPSNVEVYTSPDLRPRLEWSIMNPIEILYIHPEPVGQELILHTGFNSPWGNYDVDEGPGGVEVTIEGPSEAQNVVRAAVVQRTHEHGYHFEPVDMTYVWPYQKEGADNGDYTITVTARNDQGTATATGTAVFKVGPNVGVDTDGNEVQHQQGDEGSQDTPAVGPLAALGLLGAAVALRRRR